MTADEGASSLKPITPAVAGVDQEPRAMGRRQKALVASLLLMLAVTPAVACIEYTGLDLRDVLSADVIVEGEVSRYELVYDEDKPRWQEKMLLDSPKFRETFGDKATRRPRYARLTIKVSAVLLGAAPKTLTVAWRNSIALGMPSQIEPGQHLIALRHASAPPARSADSNGTLESTPEPGLPSILEETCGSSFILEINSWRARTIRHVVTMEGQYKSKRAARPSFLRLEY